MHLSQTKPKSMAHCWTISMRTEGRNGLSKSSVEGYPLAVGGSIIETNSFVMSGSTLRCLVYEANSNHMLALRCAKYNAHWIRCCAIPTAATGNVRMTECSPAEEAGFFLSAPAFRALLTACLSAL